MSRVVLPVPQLERLRKIGDLRLEKLLKDGLPVLANVPPDRQTFENLRLRTDLLPRAIKPDPDKLALAQRLFGDYAAEISGALLLAALPQSYATEYGAAVLGAHGELTNNLTRRIGRTAQFLLTVTQSADKAADQSRLWDWRKSAGEKNVDHLPWAACVQLRIFHQIVREQLMSDTDPRIKELLGTHNNPPLNQEDLLGMMLTFSFAVFEVLEHYGISWTADEQEAYLHLWDLIGGYLAIGSTLVKAELKPCRVPSTWQGLRPPTIGQSRDLLDQIRARQWLDPTPRANVAALSWTALRSGRVLARALLDELEEGMPPLLKPLPIAVMRALNTDVVRERLNLGGNGVILQSLTLLPKREVKIARFTSFQSPNRLAGRVLRTLANEVTARSLVHLVQEFSITFPGAPDWHRTP